MVKRHGLEIFFEENQESCCIESFESPVLKIFMHSGKQIFPGGASIIEFNERCDQVLGWKGDSLEAKDVGDI